MKIKDFIEHQNITASEFAKMVGVSDGAMSLYISEDRFPRPKIAKRIILESGMAITWDDLYPESILAA